MTTRFDPKGWMLGVAVVALAAAGAVLVQASDGATPAGQVVVPSAEPQRGVRPSVSDDGRWVVYEGAPAVDDGRSSTVWLVDRAATVATGPVELTVPDEQLRSGDSVRPVISGDGCTVAVVTQLALDLFRDDDRSARWDVYRLVLPHCGGDGDWDLVSSTSSTGSSAMASDAALDDETPAVSWTGATVAYAHRSLLDASSIRQVSVVDMTVPLGDPARVVPVPGLPATVPGNSFVHRGQSQPDLSADGRVVVFSADVVLDTDASEWAEGPVAGGPARSQVYLWARDEGDSTAAVRLVSGVDGRPAEAGAAAPVIAADGGHVAFVTSSSDLIGAALGPSCGAGCPSQILRFDTSSGQLLVVGRRSVVGSGVESPVPTEGVPGGAWSPSISADGRLIAFVTRDRELFPVRSEVGPHPLDGDVVVADLDRGELTRVSTLPDGATPASATSAHPVMSASGHVVVFDSLAGRDLGAGAVVSGDALTGGRHAIAVQREAQLVPASLEVGTVQVGVPGPEWYVAVYNEGPSTFVPARVESTDPRFAVTGGTCGLGVPVGAGESCTVYVTLTPDAPGPVTATIDVADALFGGSSATVTVTGSGGEPALDPTPAGADFPLTLVGEAAPPIAFDIANIGFQADAVVAIDLTGPHPDDFELVGTSCSGVYIYPTTSCSVEMRFRPLDSGHRSAVVRITSATGATTSVVVSGVGRRVVSLEVVERQVRAGRAAVVVARGFPAGALVTLGWADGRGESRTLVAGPEGVVLAELPTRMNDKPGDRTVVVSGAGHTAQATIEITRRRSTTPFGT